MAPGGSVPPDEREGGWPIPSGEGRFWVFFGPDLPSL
jgi:hypothetical protein